MNSETLVKEIPMPRSRQKHALDHLKQAALRRLAAAAIHHREARQAQHRRAVDRRQEAGLIRIWKWVPEEATGTIKALMADLVTQLEAGHQPRLVLVCAGAEATGKKPAASTDGARGAGHRAAAGPEKGRTDGVSAAPPRARKRMRNRRAAARRQEAGLKRIAITVPQQHQRVLRAQLDRITGYLQEGRSVRLDSVAPADTVASVRIEPGISPVVNETSHATGCPLFDDIHAQMQTPGHVPPEK